MNAIAEAVKVGKSKRKTVYPILFSMAFAHFTNDLLQIIIPSVYPILKESYSLSFTQIGIITFCYQFTASLLQPVVGFQTDKRPMPYSLAIGMIFTLVGIVLLSMANGFALILLAVGIVGIGSSIFHPEASRVAYLAAGGRRGLAQSIFQVGGNAGTAAGPLLVILIVVPHGQSNIIWFVIAAILGIFTLWKVGNWYTKHLDLRKKNKQLHKEYQPRLSKKQVKNSIGILLLLIFSKYIYMTSITTYFTLYVIEKFNVEIEVSQYYLFLFLAAVAAGTLIGGPLGDKFGRKYIIWFSILGAAPFSLMLPYVDLFWTAILVVIIGVILASAFSAILVYAQELLPGKVGMVSGLFFGFAFGIAGVGSALLGFLADYSSLEFVYKICAFLPLIGIFTYFLPNIQAKPSL